MMVLITGGSGSGKSAYAEERVSRLYQEISPKERGRLLYVATMEPYGEEGQQRIARHHHLRAGKGFATLECYTHLEKLPVAKNDVVLVECLSNLTANEMFSREGRGQEAAFWVEKGIRHLINTCSHVVLVGNQVFSDGISYEASTMAYLEELAKIQNLAAQLADEVVEVVCGIPLLVK
jgi:adenosylcobinamide kinase/adenosylcobinamide-phosphate guanylyltransferase